MKRVRILVPSIAALAVAIPAYAQERQEDPDVVVITAQRREESIQDVGLTVTALGEETIRDARVLQMRDITTFVPNVDVREQAPGLLPVITIRGVGLNDFSATNNPSAGVYVDDIALSSLVLLAFDFYDLERIEILKGPQGTLYGRNSTAGAINFISARPNTDRAASLLSVSYGNFDTLEVEGMANLPVTDTLSVRLSGKTIQQGEGYYFNRTNNQHIGDRDVTLGRAQIRWQPNDNTDINFKLDGFSVSSTLGQGSFFGAYDFGNPPTFACAALAQGRVDPTCTSPLGYSDPDGDPFTGDWSPTNYVESNQLAATLHAAFDLGEVELTSITGYIDSEGASYSDIDATPDVAMEFIPTSDIKQLSQEFRLAGNINDQTDWLAGIFFSRDDITIGSTGLFDDLLMTRTSQFGDQKTESAAAFTHVEYQLTDAIKLIGGLRYTWEEKTYSAGVFDENPFGTSCLLSATCTPGPTPPIQIAGADNSKIDDTNWSWRVGVDWKPWDSTLLFASVSRGVKSGGFFSGFATNNLSFVPYEPESLVSYEVGVKHESDDNALRLSASAFYYDYADIQTFVRDQASAIPLQRLGNIDEATVYGLDLEAAYRVPQLEGLTVAGGIGLLESELGAFQTLSGITPAGNELPNAPGTTFNASVTYEWNVSPDLTGKVQLDGRYSGSTFKDATNDPLIASDDYGLLNGRIALSEAGGAWDLALWANNLTDERYKVQGVNILALGFGYENYNSPRTYGVSLTFRH